MGEGGIDSLKVWMDEAPDGIIQSCSYTRSKSDHYVTAVLCFAPDSTILAYVYNIPQALMTVQ